MDKKQPNSHNKSKTTRIRRKAFRAPYPKSKPTTHDPFPKRKIYHNPYPSLLEQRVQEANTSFIPTCTPCVACSRYLNDVLNRGVRDPAPMFSVPRTRDYDYLMRKFATYSNQTGSMSTSPGYLYGNSLYASKWGTSTRGHSSPPVLFPVVNNYELGRNHLGKGQRLDQPGAAQRIHITDSDWFSPPNTLRKEYIKYYSSYVDDCDGYNSLDMASRAPNGLVCKELHRVTPITSKVRNSSAFEKMNVKQLESYKVPYTSNSGISNTSGIKRYSPKMTVDNTFLLDLNDINMEHFKAALVCAKYACKETSPKYNKIVTHEAGSQTRPADEASEVDIQDENTDIVEDVPVHSNIDVSNVDSTDENVKSKGTINIVTEENVSESQPSLDPDNFIVSKSYVQDTLEKEMSSSLRIKSTTVSKENYEIETNNSEAAMEEFQDILEFETPDSRIYVKDTLKEKINKALQSNKSITYLKENDAIETNEPKNDSSSNLEYEDSLIDTETPDSQVFVKTALLEEINTALQSVTDSEENDTKVTNDSTEEIQEMGHDSDFDSFVKEGIIEALKSATKSNEGNMMETSTPV